MAPLTFAYGTRIGLDGIISEWASKRALELRQETWATLWDSLRDAIFARHGIEVSEIGTTWQPTLVGMNALRPFQANEVAYIGGEKAFPPSVWKTTQIDGDKRIWSIPWSLDTRVIYYWADMLEAVGLDAATAFSTPEQLTTTLDLLRSQVETPWGINTLRETMTVQNIASWIWQAGGDFVTADGRKTRFTEPQTLHAIEQFYNLYAYMPQQTAPFDTEYLADLFASRRIAAVINGPWFTSHLHQRLSNSESLGLIRAALPPGPPFLGGTNLVILSHTAPSSERAAIELIKWLVSQSAQEQSYKSLGMLPVRPDIFTSELANEDPITACYLEAVHQGRSTSSIFRWGLVEERLVDALSAIWVDVQTTQKPITEIVKDRLQRAAQSLDIILAQ